MQFSVTPDNFFSSRILRKVYIIPHYLAQDNALPKIITFVSEKCVSGQIALGACIGEMRGIIPGKTPFLVNTQYKIGCLHKAAPASEHASLLKLHIQGAVTNNPTQTRD